MKNLQIPMLMIGTLCTLTMISGCRVEKTADNSFDQSYNATCMTPAGMMKIENAHIVANGAFVKLEEDGLVVLMPSSVCLLELPKAAPEEANGE